MTRIGVLLANGLFVRLVFASERGTRNGAGRAGWVRPSTGPVLERTASLGLVAGWSLQLLSMAGPGGDGRRQRSPAQALVAMALAGAGIRLAVSAQDALGLAWRTSVIGTGAAPLSTGGPYRVVRHPVYTAMLAMVAANLMVGRDRLAAAGAVLACAALELQVRGVEEPALLSAYGESYRQYSAATGRFVPILGRLD